MLGIHELAPQFAADFTVFHAGQAPDVLVMTKDAVPFSMVVESPLTVRG